MKYKHIIWDWNGTLLDDAWLCVEIMNQLLDQQNLPRITIEEYGNIFIFPVKDYYEIAGFDFEKVPFEYLSDAFIEQYEARKFECPVREFGTASLKKINQKGIPQSIISASGQTSLHQIVTHYQLFDQFISVRGLDNHHAFGKLDIGRQWMQELNLPPKEILMVGDTLHDYELAQDLGIDCVLIFSGHQSRERLAASGAKIINSLDELEIS
jgi:phosphoglycolate phosphatase